MVAMNDSTRRLIMMLTIILAGTAVTFLELSPLIVFIVALTIGIVMLFGLNILSFDEMKEDLSLLKTRLNQPVSLRKDKDETAEKKTQKTEDDGKKREIPFSGIIEKLPFKRERKSGGAEKADKPAEKRSFLSGLTGMIKSGESKEDKTKKIDELLDKTINEPGSGTETPEETPVGEGEKIEEDDFSDFEDLDLGLEDEDEDSDTDLEDEETAPDSKSGNEPAAPAMGAEGDIPDSTIADILAKEGVDFDLDSDDEFPEMAEYGDESGSKEESGSEIGSLDELDDDVSGIDLEDDDMDEFDQVDLNEIEPEEEPEIEDEEEDIELGDSDEEPEDVVMAPPDESDDLFSAPPKEWSQTGQIPGQEDSSSDESSLALSFGDGGDDEDLFAMLKSDTKKAVVVQELSLVRNLKDETVESRELVDGLESVLNNLGVKVEKIEEEEDSNQKTITEGENGVQ